MRYQCLPYHRNSRLQAVIEELEHTAGIGRDDDHAAMRAKLEAHLAELDPNGTMTPLLAALLSIPSEERGDPACTRAAQAKTLDALVQRLRAMAARRPLLVVFEDVHWIDPTSGSCSSAWSTACVMPRCSC